MSTKNLPAVAYGIPLTDSEPDEQALQFARLTQLVAARIASDASKMESIAAEQFIAGQVFELVEGLAEISQDLAMAVAQLLTNDIRRVLTH